MKRLPLLISASLFLLTGCGTTISASHAVTTTAVAPQRFPLLTQRTFPLLTHQPLIAPTVLPKGTQYAAVKSTSHEYQVTWYNNAHHLFPKTLPINSTLLATAPSSNVIGDYQIHSFRTPSQATHYWKTLATSVGPLAPISLVSLSQTKILSHLTTTAWITPSWVYDAWTTHNIFPFFQHSALAYQLLTATQKVGLPAASHGLILTTRYNNQPLTEVAWVNGTQVLSVALIHQPIRTALATAQGLKPVQPPLQSLFNTP